MENKYKTQGMAGFGQHMGGLLGNPMFMAGAGLLSGNGWGGALQGLAAAQGYKLSESRMKKDEEKEARLKELQDMQMRAAKQAEDRQQYTQALLAAGSSQNPGLLQDPTFQAQLRQKAAAYGDPQALEQGGLLAPLPTATKAPDKVQMYEFAKQQGYGGSFMDFLQQDASTGANAGQYFSGVTVKMPDGSYAVVQPGNRPGMPMNTLPLPGAPVTYDTALAEAMAAARAQGTKIGEKTGTTIANTPDMNLTISELEALVKDGGLLDKATGSGAGAQRDSALAYLGYSTGGAEAVAQLKPIADRVLKMVPRFEGPQSDKDTQSYRDAAGNLADPTIPAPVKKAAAKEILRLMQARKGQFVSPDASSVDDLVNKYGN